MTTTQPTTAVPCAHCGTLQTNDPRTICHTCANQLAADLHATPELLELLDDTTARLDRIDRRPNNDDDIRRTLDARYALTAAATPSPISLGASDAAAALTHTLRTWAAHLTPDAHHATPTHLATWLAHRAELIRRQTWAADCLTDIARSTARAWALVDRPPDTWFAGICDTPLADPDTPGTTYACGWELRPRLTEPTTRCPGCGTTHDVHTQRARLIARMADTLVTATDAARALSTPDRPVTGEMVRGWKHRGHLEPATITDPDTGSTRPAYDHAGRPLYRLGDVQTIDNRLRWGATTAATGRAS